MSYLYLNFVNNLDTERSGRSNEIYTASLNEQYEAIKRKFNGYAPDTLQEFIASCLSPDSSYYYISLPSFDRGFITATTKNGQENEYLNNIIIRPCRTSRVASALPEDYDLILIGDVTFGKMVSVTVKGIDLIDVNVAKFGEKRVICAAKCAFTKKRLMVGADVPDFGCSGVQLQDSVLTHDFVESLCNDVYPVPDARKVLKIFDAWKKYIEFRRYYLEKQSERCEDVASVEVCDAYMVTRYSYIHNRETNY